MSTGFAICHSCATYLRARAIEVGGFSPHLRARIDFDLWLRLATSGYWIANSPEILGVHVKRTGTYFDKQFGRPLSRSTATTNFIAVRRMGLGAKGYALATARVGYSLARRSSVKSTPRFGRDLGTTVPEELSRITAGMFER